MKRERRGRYPEDERRRVDADPWPRHGEDTAAEVREELESHFEGSVALLVARGWSEQAARVEVRRRFGDETRYLAVLERGARWRAMRRRVKRGAHMVVCAVLAGLRDVRRSPGLSTAVVATLVLGLGANAAVFRVLDRLLLSPPPHVRDASEVRRLHQTMRRGTGEPRTWDAFTYVDVRSMREASPGIVIGAALHYVPETLGSGESALRVRVTRVDADYLPLVGVRAALGRGLLREDHAAAAPPVAVLGHALWQAQFGGERDVLGRTIRVARGEYEVVGVMPRGFFGAQAPATDVWIPLEGEAPSWWGPGWRDDSNVLAFRALARLPRGTDRSAWEERMAQVLRRSAASANPRVEVLVFSTSSLVPGDAPNPSAAVSVSRWMAGVSLLVLLVACANAANLFLAHGERHRRAAAVRMALGAGATALRMELLVRSLTLALLGAGGAALLALWGGGVLEALFFQDMELPTRPETLRLLLFTGGLALLAALLAGLLPALRAPRCDIRSTLERGGRVIEGGGRLRSTLAGLQIGLSMVLLVGAGLFVASFRAAHEVDLGFVHDRLMMVRLELEAGVETPREELYAAAAEGLRTLPGVLALSGTVAVPFTLLYGLSAGLPGGEPIEGLHMNAVGPDFFRTLGVPVLRGRAFEEGDTRPDAEPVAVVSRRAAERLWPGQDPLGKCVQVGTEAPTCTRVVGVAAEHAGVTFAPGQLIGAVAMQGWVSLGHSAAQRPSSLLVRTAGPPERQLEAIRRRAAAVPGVRYVETMLLDEAIERETRAWRLGTTVFSFFGLIAVAVAAVGLQGVLAFEVALRRRDFGIRLALGAGRRRVIQHVVHQAVPTVLLGLMGGAAMAAALGSRLGPLLFGVSPREPAVFGAAALCLLAVSAAALFVPAWRAARVDPRETLA